MSVQVRIGGFGGQGIVSMGALLGQAACLYDGKDAVFTQAYGPEARGGAARADLIIADQPIDYPYVERPDILVVLFQEAYDRFADGLAPGGVLILESDLVRPRDTPDMLAVPASRMAEELGGRIAASVLMLGCVVQHTALVSESAVAQAIRATMKPQHVALNLRAFEAGHAFAASGQAEATA